MPGEIVASNSAVRETLVRLRDEIQNTNLYSLRLFINDFIPKPGDAFGSFTEATYTGYARKAMQGKLKNIFKVEDGVHQVSSVDFTFLPGGPSLEKVFGWYVCRLSKVWFSCRLPFPVLMTTGQSLTVRIDLQTWALSLLKREG